MIPGRKITGKVNSEQKMERFIIQTEKFKTQPTSLFDDQWLLLTCGDFATGNFNCMTISWGSLGTIWNRPFAQVVVRPQRFTFEFMERYDNFSLCAFPVEYRPALNLLGSKSGRDSQKMKESGLTPCSASIISSPIYQEAELAIECRKIYWQDLTPAHFLDSTIARNYPQSDYHRVYFGEILTVSGTAAFSE